MLCSITGTVLCFVAPILSLVSNALLLVMN